MAGTAQQNMRALHEIATESPANVLNFRLIARDDIEPPADIPEPTAGALVIAAQGFLERLHVGAAESDRCLLCSAPVQTAERPGAYPAVLVSAVFAECSAPSRIWLAPVCAGCAAGTDAETLQRQVMRAWRRAVPGLDALPPPGHA